MHLLRLCHSLLQLFPFFLGRDSPNSHPAFIRIVLPVSTACLFIT
jgi:hypothetical protein